MDAITLVPAQTALLVVDVQEKLLPAMHAPDAARMLRAIDLLLEAAQRMGVPVFVTEQYPSGLGPTVPAIAARLAALQPQALPVAKTVFSALAPHEVAQGLADVGARSVVVVGVEAHVCVFMTARDLVRAGFHAHVPFDAVASRDPGCKSTALAALAAHGVTVTTTETVVFDLLGDAKNLHFRPLSKLVRDLLG
ncbi:MAG: Isochorismatase [Myxococcaceae bacterium]|nr:Isochorismatase [Myxococcaceae bacterium]